MIRRRRGDGRLDPARETDIDIERRAAAAGLRLVAGDLVCLGIIVLVVLWVLAETIVLWGPR